MAVTITDVRGLMRLDGLNDGQIQPHLNRAVMDFEHITAWKSAEHEKEVVGCRCIYYLHPLLWVKISRHLDEIEEQFQTMRDAKEFADYWWRRSLLDGEQEVEEEAAEVEGAVSHGSFAMAVV